MTRFVVFHRTVAELERFVAANGLPAIAPTEWAYISESAGVRPWRSIGSPKVFGVEPTDKDVSHYWRQNGIELKPVTGLQYSIPFQSVCPFYVVNGELEYNGLPEQKCTLVPGHQEMCSPLSNSEVSNADNPSV